MITGNLSEREWWERVGHALFVKYMRRMYDVELVYHDSEMTFMIAQRYINDHDELDWRREDGKVSLPIPLLCRLYSKEARR